MAMRRREESGEQLRPFVPRFPFYLVVSNGSPIVGNDGDTAFVMACATLELGELIVSQFRAEDSKSDFGLSQIVDHESLADASRQLIDQDVTHMSWNATRHSRTVNVVDLGDFVRS